MPFTRPAALAAFFTPSTTAVGGSVFLTAAVGLLPLIAFFVLMGVLKVKTHWCSMISLGLAAVIAIVFFDMPVAMTAMSAAQGAIMGLIPIVYIIVAAVWLYNLTEASGRSADLRAVFNAIGKGDMAPRPSLSPSPSAACWRAWRGSARQWPLPPPWSRPWACPS